MGVSRGQWHIFVCKVKKEPGSLLRVSSCRFVMGGNRVGYSIGRVVIGKVRSVGVSSRCDCKAFK